MSPACPSCRGPLSFERTLSDPWRQRIPGARHFKVRSSGSLPYVLSCSGCLAAVQVQITGESGAQKVQVGDVLVRSLRMLEMARSLEHAQAWAVAERMLGEPLEAELLGTPELFCRVQHGIGSFVRLMRKARVDMRRDPAGLLQGVGPRNLYTPDQLQHGPVLPMAFKLFPLGIRNGLLRVRPDRIRSTDGRQLPELLVPLAWVRLQPQSFEQVELLPLPSVPKPLPVEVEEEPELTPPVAADPFAMPEAAGLIAQVEEEERAPPVSPMASMLDSDLDAEALHGWVEEDSDDDSSWVASSRRSAELATELASDWRDLLIEHMGPPSQSLVHVDSRLPLTVHVFAQPAERCVTLVTDGMRRHEMAEVGPSSPRRLELCWTLSEDLVQDLDSWPVALLLRLARLPMLSRSATWPGDVLGPLRPGLGETGMRDVLLWPSERLPVALRDPLTGQGRVQVLSLWPLSRAHAAKASLDGAEPVLAELRAAGRSEAFKEGGVGAGD